MATATRTEKIKFAKEQYKKGVTAPARLQQLIKKKFGTGMNFRDMGKVFPQKPGAKKKAAKKRGRPAGSSTGRGKAGRPRKKGGRRGRPVGYSSNRWLLLSGDEVELFGSMMKLKSRVADLIGEGIPQADIAVFEKTSMKMTIKTSVSL